MFVVNWLLAKRVESGSHMDSTITGQWMLVVNWLLAMRV